MFGQMLYRDDLYNTQSEKKDHTMNENFSKILESSLDIQLSELLNLSIKNDSPENKEIIAKIIERIYLDNILLSERFSLKTFSDFLLKK